MEPVTIAIICAAAFGVVAVLSAFIRHLLLSRDKNLNDQAQHRALTQEANELEKLRKQMASTKRFDSHYQVLGANKDAIQYLDQKIEEILKKKSDLIERYAQMTIKQSSAIIDGEPSLERKALCDRLKLEIDSELKFYDAELEQWQSRRASLWDTHADLQEYLLSQESKRNKHLDSIYDRHSVLLEKIYLRHNENSEAMAKQSIDAGTKTFKMMIMAPILFLMQFFSLSTGINLDQAKNENKVRDEVEQVEKEINGEEKEIEDVDNTEDETDDESEEPEEKEDISELMA